MIESNDEPFAIGIEPPRLVIVRCGSSDGCGSLKFEKGEEEKGFGLSL